MENNKENLTIEELLDMKRAVILYQQCRCKEVFNSNEPRTDAKIDFLSYILNVECYSHEEFIDNGDYYILPPRYRTGMDAEGRINIYDEKSLVVPIGSFIDAAGKSHPLLKGDGRVYFEIPAASVHRATPLSEEAAETLKEKIAYLFGFQKDYIRLLVADQEFPDYIVFSAAGQIYKMQGIPDCEESETRYRLTKINF